MEKTLRGPAGDIGMRLISSLCCLSLVACTVRPAEQREHPIRLANAVPPIGAPMADDGDGPPAPADSGEPLGRYPWPGLWRDIRAKFRQHPILSTLVLGFAVLVITKLAIAHGPQVSGHATGNPCASEQPGERYPPGVRCLATPIPPNTARPVTILKLHCGENGIIRRCEDED
jgi:hypothetical protein